VSNNPSRDTDLCTSFSIRTKIKILFREKFMKILATLLMLATLSPYLQAQSKPVRQANKPTQDNSTTTNSKPNLPIRRVVLYSNGVAYFERRGQVNNQAEISLPFKQSQVDDVLKSMVVLDLGKGQIGAVSYNSSAPPSARLAEIPFSIQSKTGDQEESDEEGAGGSGLVGVLRQLQGARVTITAANRTTTGAILTVEERKSQIDADKPPVIFHSLVLVTENGEISKFNLEDVRSVKLLDEGTRHDLKEFAEASASARRRDAKTITITSAGSGAREMLVSYVIAAPIWKTTYRIVLDSTGKPFFQGWAIVDNVGDEDWTDVSLSLVSGTPISFIQPIQQPLYRYRPIIPIPEDLQLTPQVYEPAGVIGGIESGVAGGVAGGVPGGVPGGVAAGVASRASDAPSPPPPPKSPAPTTSISDLISSEDSGVKAAATGREFGDLFEYHIDQPVTVRRDRSALIPILQTRMEGERVSIYNEATRSDRPMIGLRLKNSSALTLEGGSLTVIDSNAYAGETLMERLKPNEERFISFALDLATLVTSRSEQGRQPTFLVRILNGVLQSHYYQTDRKVYTITNQTDKPRVVYVEHPLRDKWALSDDTQKPVEKTASFYRFRVEVAPRSTFELPVTERQTLMDTYALTDMNQQYLELFVSRKFVDDETRIALEKIIQLKGQIAAVNDRIAAADRETSEISVDQKRLRENISTLKDTPETKQLIARYVAKAGEQETRLEQIAKEKREALLERTRLQNELAATIRTLTLDRKL
jgi:hypothetical protein